ncbi:lasso RiPP family leader peptide-containing protein [Streptomyces sp. NPDC050617]
MRETLVNIEPEDVYEPPQLAEVGEFAEATQGASFTGCPEGVYNLYYWC